MSTITEIPAGLATGEVSSDRPGGAALPLRLTTVWTILRFTFGLVPIVAGLDKFTNFLVHWENYLPPLVVKVLPVEGHTLMALVGVLEIVAGIVTLVRPRLGGFIVAAWLIGIAFSLFASGRYFDVAVRDLVMAVGAFTLANLTSIINKTHPRRSL